MPVPLTASPASPRTVTETPIVHAGGLFPGPATFPGPSTFPGSGSSLSAQAIEGVRPSIPIAVPFEVTTSGDASLSATPIT